MTTLHYLCPTCIAPVFDRDDDQALEAALGRTCHQCGNPLDGSATGTASTPPMLAAGHNADAAAETVAKTMITLPEAMRPKLVAITSATDLEPTHIQRLRAAGAVIWLVLNSKVLLQNVKHYDDKLWQTQNDADLLAQARIAWARYQAKTV